MNFSIHETALSRRMVKAYQYTGILNCRRGYETEAIQDFIWKSTVTFGDDTVPTYRKTIKSLGRVALLRV